MSTMTIGLPDLLQRLVSACLRMGAPSAEADSTAEVLLEAELRGHDTHGVRLLDNLRREYANGADRRRDIEIRRETAVSAVVDGGFHLSPHVHSLGARLAREKALSAGIGVVGVTNAGVSGALGVHAARMCGSELVALVFNSSPSVVVAPGSASPALGTNPVAVAAPGPDGEPVVLDMATSAVSFNGVRVAAGRGEQLPVGVAVDATGSVTTDPVAAIDVTGRARLLPFGGHRGFGLAFMVELLVTAQLSDAIGQRKIGPVMAEPSHFPGLYLAYRSDLLDEADRTAARTADLLAEFVADGVRYPGQVGAHRRRAALERGAVTVDGSFLAALDR